MRVALTFTGDEAEAVLQRLANPDFTPVMKAGSVLMTGSVRTNFRVGGRVGEPGSILGGTGKWKVTNNPKPLIRQGMQGGLMGSLQPAWDRSSAWVSTNKPYAAAHNFGHTYEPREGHPGFTLPARAFMVIQQDDITNILGLLRTHLLGGVK